MLSKIRALLPLVIMSGVAAMAMLVILWESIARRDAVWLLLGALSCAGIGCLGVVAVARSAAENRAQWRFAEAVRGLERLLEEKDALLGEINHRVNNNLQMVVTLLHLEAAETGEPMLSGQLEGMARRLALIGGIHGRIYAAESLARLNIGACLAEHCRSIEVDWHGEDLRCSLETALPLALIADQLLGRGRQARELHLERQEDEVMLWVREKAAGDNVPQRQTLLRLLAQQIGARFDGTAVRIPG
ncbi:MAG TPA: sensor histidine kinase, partial [Rhodospirillaceae bacterium]|nr:sensor histidine kinase [Rhodospirillaceae bacterium]